jgi:DNA polymerase-3 subunit delta'
MWKIIGHQKQIQYLEKDIAEQTIKPAYLFSGPEKIGKFTLVKRFAKLLQCPHNACGVCPVCLQIDEGTHPDTIVVRDYGESIKVDEIRDIIQRTHMTFQSPYLLVCIENIERMTEETANAFLKTLEEPPPNVVFLLTTITIHRILPTVLSRVFHIELGGVSQQELLEYLEQQFPSEEKETIEKVVMLSLHKPGLAIEMLQSRDRREYYFTLYNDVRCLLEQSSRSDRLLYVDMLLDTFQEDSLQLKQEINNRLELLLYLLQGVFLNKIQQKEHHFLSQKTLEEVIQCIEHVQEAKILLERNINKKLVLENLMLSL